MSHYFFCQHIMAIRSGESLMVICDLTGAEISPGNPACGLFHPSLSLTKQDNLGNSECPNQVGLGNGLSGISGKNIALNIFASGYTLSAQTDKCHNKKGEIARPGKGNLPAAHLAGERVVSPFVF